MGIFHVIADTDRLMAQTILTEQDFRDIASQTGKTIQVLAKKGLVALRFATGAGTLTTYNDTGLETPNSYQAGDAIVTRLNTDGTVARGYENHPNSYIVKRANIDTLFDLVKGNQEVRDDGQYYGLRYVGKNIVEAISFENGLSIIAPWGQQQSIDGQIGWLFYSRLTGEVYGCDEAGKAAYEPYDEA